MLDQINIDLFSPLTDDVCALALPNGKSLQVKIEKVSAKPETRNPYAPETQRIPFVVNLTAEEDIGFLEGLCDVAHQGKALVEGAYVSRVAPAGRDPSKAYYQLTFG